MIDAVLSYHLNPLTCGVAKFNQQLAKRLGVPCLNLDGLSATTPLVSIKWAEVSDSLWSAPIYWESYDLLLHDRTLPAGLALLTEAKRVFYADEIGCPSTLDGNSHRGTLNVLLYGMSHKIGQHTVYIERLRDLLLRAHADYTVSVSTAVHEGSPWDGAFTTTVDRLRTVFGDHLRVLGYLADDALARELQDCSAAALFFDPAVRANNTTVWGALEAGCPVITNLDGDSPADLVHLRTVFDLKRMTDWPFSHVRQDVAKRGQEAAKARSWDALIAVLRA